MKADNRRNFPGRRGRTSWMALLGALILVTACASKKPVYIPSEWQPPPATQPLPAAKPPESVQASKPAAIIKPPPAIKESDLAVPAEAPPVKPPEKKPSQPQPQRAASMHLVDQAKASLAQGKTDAAIPLLEQAIQVDVHNGEAFFTLAKAWRAKGARQKAVQFAQKAEILSQDDPPKLKQVYLLEADLHKELGDAAKAETYRQKAAKLK
jgi:Tfp pilus assembly protein PilF